MSLHGVARVLTDRGVLSAALEASAANPGYTTLPGLRAPLLAALLSAPDAPSTALVVTSTRREGEQIAAALGCLLPAAQVHSLPAWETLPHERLSPSAETAGRRLRVLRALHQHRENPEPDRPLVIVASVRAALQPLLPGLGDVEPVLLRAGSRGNSLTDISHRLAELGYQRADLVTRRGEYSVRGGILDVFGADAEHPVRAEFFGDELEQIRPFAVSDQRSRPEQIAEVELLPGRELLLTDAVRGRARQLMHEFPGVAGMLAKIAEGIPVEGMESLAPALVDRLEPLPELLPEDAAIALIEPERLRTRAQSLEETDREFLQAAWEAAGAGGNAPIALDRGGFLSLGDLRASAGSRRWWQFSPYQHAPTEADAASSDVLTLPGQALPSFAGQADGAIEHVAELLSAGTTVVIATAAHGMSDRAQQVLAERGLAARIAEDLPVDAEGGVAWLLIGEPEAGFAIPEAQFALLTEAEFFGRAGGIDSRQPKRLASRRKTIVDPLQLRPGDYVVHETHGIGRFVELTKREISTGGRNPVKHVREYLVLEYASSKRGHPGDRLSVPTDQLELLSRYVGGEEPQLSKLGGSDWAATKSKARKAVREIAVELVKLYAARTQARGHAFSQDTPWQRELEEAFPFAETPDQLTVIDEVKADMERPVPMDRLISGDVGYGKTEIAVRAAFKAVQDGKQVAVLVPTTLLVRQHFETFAERFAGFPVHLRALSRFQTDKEAREVLAGLADGSVDVVIGTHRLLSDSIVFKDLGLVIIDEEQRFGVEHKDKLKQLKTNVDVLAMSATPIPRTLELAVTGIRELSTLTTPPEARLPILSYVGPRGDQQITAAIRRELLREGQVFYVHNRVQDISRVAAHIAELVPEARIAVAHGKLAEASLERVMVDFWERKIDVLVATTIIETGLDIANANTLIIDNADKLGLSQLHQLRGRVGRGRERGYAYFLYDPDKPLSETAHDRLATIASHNELGAGMQIAMKDLELRGAGNLLGGEQSGHIAGVGFDLYLRMVGEAVGAFRGEDVERPGELRLELPVAAHLPEDWLDSERLRLEAYQKLSVAASPQAAADAVDSVLEELVDRYGALPEPVIALGAMARLRRRAQILGLTEVVALGGRLRIAPVELPDSRKTRLARLYPGSKVVAGEVGAILVPMPGSGLGHGLNEPVSDAELIEWTGKVLGSILEPDPAPPAA